MIHCMTLPNRAHSAGIISDLYSEGALLKSRVGTDSPEVTCPLDRCQIIRLPFSSNPVDYFPLTGHYDVSVTAKDILPVK